MPRGAPVDGFELAYDREGGGPPVVLLHGWPGSRGDYDALRPLLRAAADLVIPDLRGFGDSDRHDRPPARAYSADAQAASVLGLIDELGLERPLLVGYDIGSRVAQAVARRRPDRVSGLVLSPPLPGAGAVAQAAVERSPAPDQRLRVPASVVWGAHDPLFPPAWSDRLETFLAEFELRVVPSAGHFVPLEAPAELADTVRRRLAA